MSDLVRDLEDRFCRDVASYFIACLQGSTNGIPILFKVLPMVPLVIPLVPMVMPMVPLALPMVPLVSQWYHWLPLVKLPMVPLGEPRTEPSSVYSEKMLYCCCFSFMSYIKCSQLYYIHKPRRQLSCSKCQLIHNQMINAL